MASQPSCRDSCNLLRDNAGARYSTLLLLLLLLILLVVMVVL